jgi:hypothetical protein
MAQQPLDLGSQANDGTGDTLRAAMTKVEANFTELYASPLFSGDLLFSGNNISSTRSNDDIVITPAGTGTVQVTNLTIDSNINITDNEITTTQSNSDLVLSASGSGKVVIASADINGGNIDGTVIGANSAAAGTFTTLTVNNSMIIDGVTIADNTISTNQSNADLELSGNGTGAVTISGFTFPTSDGSAGQFLKTDGAGNLGFASAGTSLLHSDIGDATVSLASSATDTMDTFDTTTYRSAKYFISLSDASTGRYEIVEANVVHGPSSDSTTEAFITVFGSTTNHTSPLATFTADVNNGLVRVRATNNSSNSITFKYQRVAIDI